MIAALRPQQTINANNNFMLIYFSKYIVLYLFVQEKSCTNETNWRAPGFFMADLSHKFSRPDF